ncbi:MAG: DinB family protein [Roseiflexaceae bacterium]
MLLKPVLTQMIAYHVTATRKLWDAIEPLGDAVFVTENTYGVGSIRNHMVHLISVDAAWLNGLRGHPREAFRWIHGEEYATISSARAHAEQVMDDLLTQVQAWDEADFVVTSATLSELRWQVLVHLTTHGVDHRSQVLALVTAAGGISFPQDFIMHVWGWPAPPQA